MPECQSELGTKIFKSSGNMTMVIDNLEKRGLVDRRSVVEDRRLTETNLRAKGRTLVQRILILPRHAAQITGALGRLAAADHEPLGAWCRKLGWVD